MNVFAADVFPEWSEAVHETVVLPSVNVEPELGLQETVGDGSSASVALGENVTTAPLPEVASAVVRPGTVRMGGVLSLTVTLNVPGAEVLPDASIAMHETGFVPIAKVVPEAGLHEIVGFGSIASCADTEKVTIAPPVDVASTENDAGTVMVGAAVS